MEKIQNNDEASEKKKKLYDFLINPKTVLKSGLTGVCIYAITLILSMILASIKTPDFNIGVYSISSLGGDGTNLAPWLIDMGFILMAIGLIPVLCYLNNMLAPYPTSTKDMQDYSKFRSSLGSNGTLFIVLGLIFMGLVGVFSVDNDPTLIINYFYPDGDGVGMHLIVSWIAMASITIGGIFFGMIIAFYETLFPKALGFFMIFIPIIPFVLLWYGQPKFVLFEWILQFTYMGWGIPGGLILIKHLLAEIKN
ncbi:MAG: hypothetical protein GY870_16330 [archaeon]|nr:hypothetical protein [archaeon]